MTYSDRVQNIALHNKIQLGLNLKKTAMLLNVVAYQSIVHQVQLTLPILNLLSDWTNIS